MSYLYIYVSVGLLLALWDFRKYLKLAFWHIRFWNVEEYVAVIAYGPKPSVDLWSMPSYIRERNYFIALIFVLLWPIKLLFFTPRLNAFIRNIRAGRISMIPKKKRKIDEFTLEKSLQKYQNIVDCFLLGKESDDWIQVESKVENKKMKIIIHNDAVFYNQTLRDSGCPTKAKYTIYTITSVDNSEEGIIWNVEEVNGSFDIRMTGYGSENKYHENSVGKIFDIKQIKNSVS